MFSLKKLSKFTFIPQNLGDRSRKKIGLWKNEGSLWKLIYNSTSYTQNKINQKQK